MVDLLQVLESFLLRLSILGGAQEVFIHSLCHELRGHEVFPVTLPFPHTRMFPLESPVMASPFSANVTQMTNLGFSCFCRNTGGQAHLYRNIQSKKRET